MTSKEFKNFREDHKEMFDEEFYNRQEDISIIALKAIKYNYKY
jgi:hypothetical protein